MNWLFLWQCGHFNLSEWYFKDRVNWLINSIVLKILGIFRQSIKIRKNIGEEYFNIIDRNLEYRIVVISRRWAYDGKKVEKVVIVGL